MLGCIVSCRVVLCCALLCGVMHCCVVLRAPPRALPRAAASAKMQNFNPTLSAYFPLPRFTRTIREYATQTKPPCLSLSPKRCCRSHASLEADCLHRLHRHLASTAGAGASGTCPIETHPGAVDPTISRAGARGGSLSVDDRDAFPTILVRVGLVGLDALQAVGIAAVSLSFAVLFGQEGHRRAVAHARPEFFRDGHGRDGADVRVFASGRPRGETRPLVQPTPDHDICVGAAGHSEEGGGHDAERCVRG